MNVMKQYDNSSSLSDVNTNNNNDDNVDIISTQRDINAFGSTSKREQSEIMLQVTH